MLWTPAVALAGMASVPTPSQPLTANNKWSVNFAPDMCVVERNYGPADASTILALRPAPLAHNVEVRISEVDPAYVSRTDEGTVTLRPSGRTFPVKINSFGPVANGRRVTSFFLKDVETSELVLASEIAIDRGRAGAPLLIAPGGSDGLVATVTRCGDSLLRQWGVDPVAMRSLSRQPQPVGGAESKWFKPRDYPQMARKNYRSGRTLALVGIGADGRVTKCNIAASAGNPDLDSRTCTVLTERGRYEPGLNASGSPVPSQKLVGVMWAMWRFFGR